MKKTIPILLSAALLLSACGQAAGTAETTSADAPAAVTETTAQTSAPKTTPGGVDKAETVYAKANADGTVTETTVEAVLKARDGATIEDVAALRDIINKEGDEAYTTGADNALTWENSGVAPLYFDLPAELSLYTGTQGDSAIYGDGADNAGGTNTVGETDSDIPVYTAAVDILLSELQPGDVFETVTFIPASLPACGELRLGIIDPMTGKASVSLVSNQQYKNGEAVIYTFR